MTTITEESRKVAGDLSYHRPYPMPDRAYSWGIEIPCPRIRVQWHSESEVTVTNERQRPNKIGGLARSEMLWLLGRVGFI
ncbi:hypothetical protein VTL71DRAFT_15447, partial [Oculimacula yallundae]